MNLIEDDQAEDSSDAGDGSDAEIRICIMNLGDERYFVFQAGKELIIIVQQLEVKFNAFSYALIRESFGYPFSVGFIGDFLSYVWQIVLVIGILDMGKEFCSFSSKMHPSAQQIPG
jgi:hypothetical protein